MKKKKKRMRTINRRISEGSDDEGVFLYFKFFWKTNAIQNVHIGICREFDELSKYVITFLTMLLYVDGIPKILCPTIFSRGYIQHFNYEKVFAN